jgi:hypothetical protein
VDSSEVSPYKVYREFIIGDGDNEPSRFDFYGEMGNIASTYELHMTSIVTVELQRLGYVVEDYPSLKKEVGK